MKSRKSLFGVEIFITIAQLFILTIAICLQFSCIAASIWCSVFGCFPTITESDAGIFLQVDATVLSLSISLVAIMSAVLPDTYMGISYSHYFLNLRPRLYKQIRIILLSLLYFVLATFSLWLKLNYMVLAFLLCEILLIIMSALSVYSIFYGRAHTKKEISEHSYKSQIGK